MPDPTIGTTTIIRSPTFLRVYMRLRQKNTRHKKDTAVSNKHEPAEASCGLYNEHIVGKVTRRMNVVRVKLLKKMALTTLYVGTKNAARRRF